MNSRREGGVNVEHEFRRAESLVIRYNRDCNMRFLGRGGKEDARRRRLRIAADNARKRLIDMASAILAQNAND